MEVGYEMFIAIEVGVSNVDRGRSLNMQFRLQSKLGYVMSIVIELMVWSLDYG